MKKVLSNLFWSNFMVDGFSKMYLTFVYIVDDLIYILNGRRRIQRTM